MGGLDVRAKGYVIASVVPLVVGAGEEVFYFEVLVVRNGELLEVEVDPAGLLLGGIEIDSDENLVGAALRQFRPYFNSFGMLVIGQLPFDVRQDRFGIGPRPRANDGTPCAERA